jgi:phage shock protein PspC (stress-responsive transcriptional regulator)
MASTLTRPRRGKIIAGVCAGLARRFGWSPWLVRAAFVISCVLPGPQVLVYVALWILMPQDA